MEAVVDTIAARLRVAYDARLDGWRAEAEARIHEFKLKRPLRVFAPLGSRKRGCTEQRSAASGTDWRALLLAVFRRYAGELIVEGKLLNQRELEVHRFRRESERRSVRVLETTQRFIVTCAEDAPSVHVGTTLSGSLSPIHARVLCASVDATPVVTLMTTDEARELWQGCEDHDLGDSPSVLGFDAASFAVSEKRRMQRSRYDRDDSFSDSDVEDSSVNVVIANDITFSELRGVASMMEASGVPTTAWTSIAVFPEARALGENDVMSYVTLGKAQKHLWASERVERGDVLRKKSRWKEALVEYSSAIRLEETNVDALLKRGQVYLESRLYEDAIRDFEKVCELEPSSEDARQGLLKAKGKLGHSQRVAALPYPNLRRSRSLSSSRNTKPAGIASHDADEDSIDYLEAGKLEKVRLRKLLEEEDRQRRKKKRTRGASDEDTTDSDRESRKGRPRKKSRLKKSKKAKKSRKKHSRRRSKRSRSRSTSSSSSDDSDSSRQGRRHRDRSRSRTRDRSRSRSRTRHRRSRSRDDEQRRRTTDNKQPPHGDAGSVHPILERKPHRLWN